MYLLYYFIYVYTPFVWPFSLLPLTRLLEGLFFDGFHLGHKKIISQLLNKSMLLNGESVVKFTATY